MDAGPGSHANSLRKYRSSLTAAPTPRRHTAVNNVWDSNPRETPAMRSSNALTSLQASRGSKILAVDRRPPTADDLHVEVPATNVQHEQRHHHVHDDLRSTYQLPTCGESTVSTTPTMACTLTYQLPKCSKSTVITTSRMTSTSRYQLPTCSEHRHHHVHDDLLVGVPATNMQQTPSTSRPC